MKLKGKSCLVIGAAKSGVSAGRALIAAGAGTFIFDKDRRRAQAAAQLIGGNCRAVKKLEAPKTGGLLRLKGSEGRLAKTDDISLVVVSPGVPLTEKYIKQIRKQGIELIGELELGYRLIKFPLYAITGTNGKTTCTELLGAIFRRANYKTHVLGNVGTPLSSVAGKSGKSDIGVVEVSSFQLETIADFHAFGIGITNIVPDHLDRHGTMEAYIQIKFNIFKNTAKTDFVVLNADDHVVAGFADKLNCRVYYFSLNKPVQGTYVKDGVVVFCEGKKATELFKADELKIKGEHNLSNAMMCACMAFLAGVDAGTIREAATEFNGVPHRLEFVAKLDEVDYYNDSKATNPGSTLTAVKAFGQPIVLLLGGSDKGSDFLSMFRQLPANVRAVLVYGATKRKLAAAAKKAGFLAYETAADLQAAVRRAQEVAKAGEVVLLSPACASFDAFRNFEHRGEVFKNLIQEQAEKILP